MKQMIAAIATVLLLCGSAAFAQGVVVPPDNGSPPSQTDSITPAQTQSALDSLKSMTPEQRQQLFQMGADKVKSLTPDQIQALKDKLNSLTPEQKQQAAQMLQSSPQLKDAVQQKLDSLTPEQKQQLQNAAGQQ